MSVEFIIIKLVCNVCGATSECPDGIAEWVSRFWYYELDSDYAECPECAAKLKALTEGL